MKCHLVEIKTEEFLIKIISFVSWSGIRFHCDLKKHKSQFFGSDNMEESLEESH